MTPDHPYANQEEFYEECDRCHMHVALPKYTSNRSKLCAECYAEEMEHRRDCLEDR